MEIQLFDHCLLSALHSKAENSERKRMNHDLRTTPEDTSQRMLNALEPGTRVAIHRHQNTSETVVCLEGCLDWILYDEMQDADVREPADGRVAAAGSGAADAECRFKEIARFRICPREQKYGIQIPTGVWHSIEVYEPSTIFEAKDGAYIQL